MGPDARHGRCVRLNRSSQCQVWLKKDGYSVFFSTWPATFVSCWLILEVCRFLQDYLRLGSPEMVCTAKQGRS